MKEDDIYKVKPLKSYLPELRSGPSRLGSVAKELCSTPEQTLHNVAQSVNKTCDYVRDFDDVILPFESNGCVGWYV